MTDPPLVPPPLRPMFGMFVESRALISMAILMTMWAGFAILMLVLTGKL